MEIEESLRRTQEARSFLEDVIPKSPEDLEINSFSEDENLFTIKRLTECDVGKELIGYSHFTEEYGYHVVVFAFGTDLIQNACKTVKCPYFVKYS